MGNRKHFSKHEYTNGVEIYDGIKSLKEKHLQRTSKRLIFKIPNDDQGQIEPIIFRFSRLFPKILYTKNV